MQSMDISSFSGGATTQSERSAQDTISWPVCIAGNAQKALEIVQQERRRPGDESFALTNTYNRVSAVLWKYAFAATVLLWCAWAAIPVLVVFSSSCQAHSVLPSIPVWSVGLSLVPLVLSLYLEYAIFVWTFPIDWSFLGEFHLLGCFKIPPTSFCLYMALLSSTGHTDMVTSSILLGRVIKSSKCPGSIVNHSSDGTFIPLPSVLQLCWIVWGLMFLELLWGLKHGIPRPRTTRTWSDNYQNDRRHTNMMDHHLGHFSWFSVWSKSCPPLHPVKAEQFHFTRQRPVGAWQFLTSLCQVSRMKAVLYRVESCILKSCPDPESLADSEKVHDPNGLVASIAGKVRRDTLRVIFTALFQSTLRTCISVTILELEKKTREKSPDRLTIISLSLSLIMVVSTVIGAGLNLRRYSTWLDAAMGGLHKETFEKSDTLGYVRMRMTATIVIYLILGAAIFVYLFKMCIQLIMIWS